MRPLKVACIIFQWKSALTSSVPPVPTLGSVQAATRVLNKAEAAHNASRSHNALALSMQTEALSEIFKISWWMLPGTPCTERDWLLTFEAKLNKAVKTKWRWSFLFSLCDMATLYWWNGGVIMTRITTAAGGQHPVTLLHTFKESGHADLHMGPVDMFGPPRGTSVQYKVRGCCVCVPQRWYAVQWRDEGDLVLLQKTARRCAIHADTPLPHFPAPFQRLPIKQHFF